MSQIAPGQNNKDAKFAKGRKPKDAGRTIRRLLSYLSSAHKFSLGIVSICIIISALAGVVSSLFLKTLIDDCITPLIGSVNPNFIPMLTIICIMMGIYFIDIISTIVSSRIMVVIAHKILKTIRDEMFEKMQSLPIRYFDTHSLGNIMSCYTNDTDTILRMITQTIPKIFSSFITIVTVFATMLYLNWILTIIIVIMISVMLIAIKYVGGASAKYFIHQQKALGKINGFIEEMISGQKVIKVFCREEKIKKEFDVLNEEYCNNATKANIFSNIFMPIVGNIGNIQFVLIAIVGGALAVFGIAGTTIGTIAAFLHLSRNFSTPVSHVSQQINTVLNALAGAERIFALMDELPETDTGRITLGACEIGPVWKNGSETVPVRGDIRFDHVYFSYVRGKEILHDISFYAKSGQKVAIIGSTGAGKTTISNLINRFYEVDEGHIYYDTLDIQTIKKSDLRKSIGFVLQEINLFSGTILENIRYGRLDATDEEVFEAARLANADDFIRKLPDGYNTVINGSGGGLSQGQEQLLSIARVAVANPPVMILDEATSSIDTRTEALVQSGLDSLMKDRTVFVIAHRLSTVRNADTILVLERGRIVEHGNHESLIARRGKYYQYYQSGTETSNQSIRCK